MSRDMTMQEMMELSEIVAELRESGEITDHANTRINAHFHRCVVDEVD